MNDRMTSRPLRLAVLASGRGSNFEAIQQAIEDGWLEARICVVISDQQGAPVLEKARQAGIDSKYIDPAGFNNRAAYEQCLAGELQARQAELVVLAGYMRLVGQTLLEKYPQRIVNIHPSLLPAFKGLEAQQQALDYGVKWSGCTVHFVDAGMDSGPIIMQAAVPVEDGDDEASLAARILAEEHRLYPRVIQAIARGQVLVEGRRVSIKEDQRDCIEHSKGGIAVKRALLSVSNKEGIVEFARGLEGLGYEIVSTGGTYQTLQDAGIKVIKVAEVTGFPEILDGRVKTLHPGIHGGILAMRSPEHLEQLAEHQISPIDVVAVNLYPFRETVARPGVSLEEAIENIDIGGPAMIRAAAKNYQDVVVVVKPSAYNQVLEALAREGGISRDARLKLALEAYSHTAMYDAMVSAYLAGVAGAEFTDSLSLAGEKVYDLRYGENPHQKAAFYRRIGAAPGLADARVLNGKELSYNNIIDTEAAWALVKEFSEPACTIIKHTNPCGTAVKSSLKEAYEAAFNADPTSAYGGIIAFNRTVDLETAEKASIPFMEVIIAPDFSPEALALFQAKKNLRVLQLPIAPVNDLQIRTVEGGFVVQERDEDSSLPEDWQLATDQAPEPGQMKDLLLAWKIVKHVKSNAIVVVRDGVSIGIGAGQMNRVGSAALALENEALARGAVMASDAYFPFRDTVELAAARGITAIVQPGGSIRDAESIEACNQHGIAMLFTGIRHFKH